MTPLAQTRAAWGVAIVSIALCLPGGCARRASASLRSIADDPDAVVDTALRLHSVGGDLEASVFLAGADGEPAYVRNDRAWQPAASAIKTAYLVELFARYAADLRAPIPELVQILAADEHPAIRHFTPAQRAEIQGRLVGANALRLGEVMIHGAGVSNVVYNAAANVATALLGGPEALTSAIRARYRPDPVDGDEPPEEEPEEAGFAVRRYMLARRDVTGDNELTPRALGRVWQRIARGDVPGLDGATLGEVRRVLELDGEPGHHFKSGSLDSHPPCRLRSGWIHREDEDVVYVIVLTLAPGTRGDGDDVDERLDAAAREITDGLLRRGAEAR